MKRIATQLVLLSIAPALLYAYNETGIQGLYTGVASFVIVLFVSMLLVGLSGFFLELSPENLESLRAEAKRFFWLRMLGYLVSLATTFALLLDGKYIIGTLYFAALVGFITMRVILLNGRNK